MFDFLKKPKKPQLIYAPKEDATTQELLDIIRVLVASAWSYKHLVSVWQGLEPKSKRHFYLEE